MSNIAVGGHLAIKLQFWEQGSILQVSASIWESFKKIYDTKIIIKVIVFEQYILLYDIQKVLKI